MEPSAQEQLLTLVTTAVKEQLDIDDFYAQLQHLGSSQEVTTTLVEIFWLLWIRLDGNSGGERRMRLIELIRSCVRDKKVDRHTAMMLLETDCMQAAGLIPDADLWKKKEIRYNTRVMYTVSKYNLLREDSEGYAKLVEALNQTGDASLTPELVKPLFRKIEALIGYFDLDPNRVLDHVLTAAELQPTNQAYLQLVPLLKRDAVVHLLGFKFQHYQAPDSPPAWHNLFLLSANLIAEGLVDLDALLGHLSPSDDEIRKAQESASAELKKQVDNIGAVNLNSKDPELQTGRGESNARAPMMGASNTNTSSAGGIIAGIRAAQQTHGGPMNSLAHGGMGGGAGNAPYGLGAASSFAPAPMMHEDRGGISMGGFKTAALKASQMELDAFERCDAFLLPADVSKNQKLALAQALLEVGAWDHATLLMGRLASLGMQAAAWGPLNTTLLNTVSKELQPIISCLAPKKALAAGLLTVAHNVKSKVGVAGGSVGIAAALPPAYTKGPPLSPRAVEVLTAIGPFLSKDPKLLMQSIQAARHHYLFYCIPPGGHPPMGTPPVTPEAQAAAAEALRETSRLEEVVARVLLPAVCLVPSMPALAHEVWQLLALMPFSSRYRLYGELKEQVERSPLLSASAKLGTYATKQVLKRLPSSHDKRELKDMCKTHCRLLGKIAASNPFPVVEAVLNTVMNYNQVDPIIEAIKLLTPFGFDTLTYTILARLSMNEDKVKEDGINISDWLQYLAKFTGEVSRKYADVDIFGLCQFLANALRAGNSLDLLVLAELVETLTGISIVPELSAAQLEAKLGGDALSSLVLMRDVDKSKKAWARGAKRLLDALQQGQPRTHLALPLFILVAQQRQAIMIHTDAQHIKFVMELYDKCHDTCQQYLEFLQTALGFEGCVKLLPDVRELRCDYKVDAEIAFMAHRPLLRKLLEALQAANHPVEEGEINEVEAAADGGVDAAGDAVMSAAGDGTAAAAAAGGEQAERQRESAPVVVLPGADVEVAGTTWQQQLEIIRQTASAQVMWERLTPYLYTLFWTLTVHDIYVPVKMYETEMEKSRVELRLLESAMSSARMSSAQSEEDLQAQRNRESQRERLKDLIKRMPAELEAQSSRVEATKALIIRDMGHFFTHLTEQSRKACAKVMVQECILPRLLCSPQDACYCAKFTELLNTVSVPFFSTVWYYNQLIRDVLGALRCITYREAVNMGCFLLETFQLLNFWRSSEKVYDEHCKSRPGFSRDLKQPGDQRTSYEQFKRLMAKWHGMIMTSFKVCLESTEYTQRRNVLTVLNRVLPVFPVVDQHFRLMKDTLEKVRSTEEREDLAVLLKSYHAAIAVEMDKPGRSMTQEAFGRLADNKAGSKTAPGRGGVSSPGAGAGGSRAAKKPSGAAPAANTTTKEHNSGPGTPNKPGGSSKPTASTTSTRRPEDPSKQSAPAAAAHSSSNLTREGGAEASRGGGAAGADGQLQEDDRKLHKRIKTELAMPGPPANGQPGDQKPPPAASRPSLKREPPASSRTGGEAGGAAAAAATAAMAPAPKRARIEPPAPQEPKGDRDGGGDGGGGHRERRSSRGEDKGKEKERTADRGGGGGGGDPSGSVKDHKGDRSSKGERDKERRDKEGGREGERSRGDKREVSPDGRRVSKDRDDGGHDDSTGITSTSGHRRDKEAHRSSDRDQGGGDRDRGGEGRSDKGDEREGTPSKRRHKDKDTGGTGAAASRTADQQAPAAAADAGPDLRQKLLHRKASASGDLRREGGAGPDDRSVSAGSAKGGRSGAPPRRG